MDIASMIMGAAIASVAWIALVPWSRLKRPEQQHDEAPGSPS
jgi:hypothetical protein